MILMSQNGTLFMENGRQTINLSDNSINAMHINAPFFSGCPLHCNVEFVIGLRMGNPYFPANENMASRNLRL